MNTQINPEINNKSPENQAVSVMTDMLAGTLTEQGIVPELSEDGTSTRTLRVDRHTLTESTSPDGTTSYRVGSLFKQAHDQGEIAVSWSEGGDSLLVESDLEIAGKRSKVVSDTQTMGYKKDDLEYIISKIPPVDRKKSTGGLMARLFLSRRR